MPQKINGKIGSDPATETFIFPISVVNNLKFRPYIESFYHIPGNIIQQPLGKLLGFFKIGNLSEDSAYIVNFLASVIKKEYYLNPRRSVEDSLDMALHKANIALSELAKNGNVDWLGAIDAAVCVLEEDKKKLHFSVTGSAKVFIFRNGIPSDISEGLAPSGEELHPLKTFVNVSGGALKTGDKVLITSDDIFQIFSLADIQKNAARFPREKFAQFLKTALVNETEAAASIIIDIFEGEKAKRKKEKLEEAGGDIFNVFSEKAFQKKIKPRPAMPSGKEAARTADYIDKKTGHIYVQGMEEAKTRRRAPLGPFWFLFKERLAGIYWWLTGKLRLWLVTLKRKIKDALWSARSRLRMTAVQGKNKFLSFLRDLKPVKKDLLDVPPAPPQAAEQPEKLKDKLFAPFEKETLAAIGEKIRRFLPDLKKARSAFSALTYQQRLYGILVLLAILIVPLVIIGIRNKISAPPPAVPQEKSQREILAADKNINLSAQAEVIPVSEKIATVEFSNNNLFLIGPQKIIERGADGSNSEFSLPQEAGNVLGSAYMEDLGLIFLLTDQNKIFSFSPVSRDIKENKIGIPENAKVRPMASYLTYLYLVDTNLNQIYRYPRAEGGFGQKINWLKEEVNLGSVSSIAIDENVYLATGAELVKLFRGKRQELAVEKSATPIRFDEVVTTRQMDKLYVLDALNSRLVVLGKNGEIISQYYHELLKGARRLAIDPQNNKAYFITADGGAAKLDL